MSVLLDTHALLWWLAGEGLHDEAVARLRDPDILVAVSAASVWEASIKRGLGKLELSGSVAEHVVAQGFEALPITLEHAEAAGRLPPHHRDPFDRMLIAQAQLERLAIMTRDPAFDAYDVDVIRC